MAGFEAPNDTVESGKVYDLYFSKDNKWLATTGTDCKIKFWNFSACNSPAKESKRFERIAKSLTFVREQIVVAAGKNKKAQIWDFNEASPKLLAEHSAANSIRCVAASEDGNLIAFGSADNELTAATVWLWDIRPYTT